MPTHVETAKGIVHEWFRWADAGGYIGHLDVPARIRLEAAIAGALEKAAQGDVLRAADADIAARRARREESKRKPKGDAA